MVHAKKTRSKKKKKKQQAKDGGFLREQFSLMMGDSQRVRTGFIAFVVLCGMGVIMIRLYGLQVSAHQEYADLAGGQHDVVIDLEPVRGEVFLKNGEEQYPLAINREYQMAYLVPKDVEDVEKTAILVAEALELDRNDVRAKLADHDDVYAVLKHRISDDEIRRIEELDLPGVLLLSEYFRYYPGDELAAQSVGFVGSDGEKFVGRYGVEKIFEDELEGEAGELQQERDARGAWLSVHDRDLTPATDGTDLELTMEYTVQYDVEQILKKTVEKHGADSGSIVVMEPRTGKLIAVANYPTFNPNDYGSVEDIEAFVNYAVSLPYESGSVFKPITMAIGLDQGKITPEATYIDPGAVSAGGFTIRNSEEKTYGLQTMTQVLEESINTGVIHVEKLVGNRVFAEYLRNFGFGDPTGVTLPLDAGGSIRNLDNEKRVVEFYTASFGQGITTTPLQLAQAYSALANGGILMRPQIISRKIFSDGTEEIVHPEELRRVISEEASVDISKMLRSVVVNGHGKRADVPGYSVGGKTGTAQVARTDAKGYDDAFTIGTFAGYAPTHDPRFVVVVKVVNPKDVIWAESVAAPAFREVMEYLLAHYNVEPTEDLNEENIL